MGREHRQVYLCIPMFAAKSWSGGGQGSLGLSSEIAGRHVEDALRKNERKPKSSFQCAKDKSLLSKLSGVTSEFWMPFINMFFNS